MKSIRQFLTVALLVGSVCFVFLSDEKTPETFFYIVVISLVYTFLLGYANAILNGILNKHFSWTTDTKRRAYIGIPLTIFLNIIFVIICNYINYVLVQGYPIESLWNGKLSFANWFFINVSLLVNAFLHAKGFMEEWKKLANKKVVEQKIIASSANAQFESLKNQLDPHFLFNSLNVLDALIEENPIGAQKFTNDMSKIYRYVLDQKDKEVVTVEEELQFAKTYSQLLKTRFEDAVVFDFIVEESVKNMFVVPLSLQLVLENAIKHNYATSKKPLFIKISSENGYLIIENNLQVREFVKERDGIGLSNIVQRYALLTTSKNVLLEKTEENFKVKIPILALKSQAMETKNKSSESIAYDRAAKRVKQLKGFYGNLSSYCIVIPFLIFVNLNTSPEYHWFWWPMLGWGIGIASHAFQTFGIGKDWEDKKIREIMEKDKNKY